LTDANKRFAGEFANPHCWLLMADSLHSQAAELYGGRSRSATMTQTNANREVVRRTREIDKPVFLLGGFALENAIKAFLIYENPSWVSNGRLSGRLKSHKLTKLQQLSKLIPYKNRYIHILRVFESGLDSWFRYPCALTVQETMEEGHLYDHLWDGYSKVMRAYGKKLRILLGRGWNGPHGWYGCWTFQGEFLGHGVPVSQRQRVRAPQH
jgi:hypothetical protein